MILYPRAGFRAKNGNVKRPDSIFTSVRLQSLSSGLGPDDEDRRLCPVRALNQYLARTEPVGSQLDRVFVSCQESRSIPVSAPTISRWIKDTVVTAYENMSADIVSLHHVRAHDTRAMATSLAKLSNIPLDALHKFRT